MWLVGRRGWASRVLSMAVVMKLGSDCGNTFPKKPWSVHVCRAARLRCPGGQGQGQPNDFLRLDVVAGLVALRLEWESPGLAVGRQKVCLAACVHAWVGLLLVAQSVVPARVRRVESSASQRRRRSPPRLNSLHCHILRHHS